MTNGLISLYYKGRYIMLDTDPLQSKLVWIAFKASIRTRKE
jgi:hypothetical protein